MPYHNYNESSLEENFKLLTNHIINNVKGFFKYNPIATKSFRKKSELPYSFIRSDNQKMFAISRNTVGFGSTGKVKVGKDIDSGEIVAVKTMLFTVNNITDYSNGSWQEDCAEETDTLKALGQLHAIAARWWNNKVGIPLPPNSTDGWQNKHTKDPVHRLERYNLKFYIFSDFFDGVTLSKYFSKNNPTIEETLKILIIVLGKLKELHEKNIIHGDVSFNNILIKKSNGKIEIHLIDFGLSGKLQNGIKKYPILDYKFDDDSYVPPECDRMISYHEIIQELVKFKFSVEIIGAINSLAITGHGFHTEASDLYSLGWWVYYYARGNERRILDEIFWDTLSLNPYCRPTLDSLIDRCKQKQQYLQELSLDSELVITPIYSVDSSSQDLSSLFGGLNLSVTNCDNAPNLGGSSSVLSQYNSRNVLHHCTSNDTLRTSDSNNALSSCNVSIEDLSDSQTSTYLPSLKVNCV
jgi:serine/threonine protein kinase